MTDEWLEDVELAEDEYPEVRRKRHGEYDFHNLLNEQKEYEHHPQLTIYDGVPRFAHKTTTAVHDAEELNCTKVIISKNHTLAAETVVDKITSGDYSVDSSSVVHVKGKERAHCTCQNGYNGNEYYRTRQIVRDHLHRHEQGLSPEVFEGTDACPYHGCIQATEFQDWVVTVPQMWTRIKDQLDDHAVIVDEEDTMAHYFPKGSSVLQLSCPPDWAEEWERGYVTTEHGFHERGIDFARQTVNNKIDDMDRVPSRYRKILEALDKYEELKEQILETTKLVRDFEDDDAVIEAFHQIDVPSVELPDSALESQGIYTYLRNGMSRSHTADRLEAMFCNPRLVAQKSGENINVRLVPDPLHDFMYNRELFTEAEHVWFIGNRMAKYTAAHFHPDPDGSYELLDANIRPDMLDILAISGEEEMERRANLTRVSRELTGQDLHNFMIAGSSRRASNVSDTIGPRSYLFKGAASLREYSDMADKDWNVTSYMGSRLTRGIDVETQVTIIRSKYFATPRWDYYRPGESVEINGTEYDTDGPCSKMQNYENEIEVHNGMLRGAGQGERHISIIPSNIDLFWGLEEYVTTFDMTDLEGIVEFVLDALAIVPEDLVCPECESKFIARETFIDHECINISLR